MTTSSNFRRDRLPHFTLAWFTFPMSTGGLALVLMNNAMDIADLKYTGRMLYFCNLAIVAGVTLMQVCRFACTPTTLVGVLKHPMEAIFVGPAILAYATVINGAAAIADGRTEGSLPKALLYLFWTYTIVSLVQGIISYFFLWNEGKMSFPSMMPGWVLPIFPSMLIGTVANAVIRTQPPARAFEIAIAGATAQGLGFAFSCFMYANLFKRLMTVGLPHNNHRPGLFMCVGPPSFTALAVIGLAKDSFRYLPDNGLFDIPREEIARILVVLAVVSAIFLWLWAAWFFCYVLVATIIGILQDPPHMTYILGWWATVFPNVGFVIATKSIAEMLDSEPIRNLAVVLTVFLMVAWPIVLVFMVEAVFSRKIMWKGKDEDRDVDAAPAVVDAHAHGSADAGADDDRAAQLPSVHPYKASPPQSPSRGYFSHTDEYIEKPERRHYRSSPEHRSDECYGCCDVVPVYVAPRKAGLRYRHPSVHERDDWIQQHPPSRRSPDRRPCQHAEHHRHRSGKGSHRRSPSTAETVLVIDEEEWDAYRPPHHRHRQQQSRGRNGGSGSGEATAVGTPEGGSSPRLQSEHSLYDQEKDVTLDVYECYDHIDLGEPRRS